MIGLAIGLIFIGIFSSLINAILMFYIPFFIFPCTFAIYFVSKFGRDGKTVINKSSVLFYQPLVVLTSSAIASIVTGLLALPIAIWVYGFSSMEEIAGGFVIASTAFYIFIIFYSGFVCTINYSNTAKLSMCAGGIFFLGSLALGPYFIIGLPVVAYVALVPYVYAFLITRKNINLTRP